MNETDLRYPVGRPAFPGAATDEQRREWVDQIAALPERLAAAVAGFTAEQWDTPYRPGGWTVRQLVHHVADSHMNAYVRFKLALTEEVPTIKPYLEAAWAELPDTASTPPEVSLALLDALHRRWVELLRALRPDDLLRAVRHPEHDRLLTIDSMLALYAWHGRHHTAHVTALAERSGWRAAAGAA